MRERVCSDMSVCMYDALDARGYLNTRCIACARLSAAIVARKYSIQREREREIDPQTCAYQLYTFIHAYIHGVCCTYSYMCAKPGPRVSQ